MAGANRYSGIEKILKITSFITTLSRILFFTVKAKPLLKKCLLQTA